MRKYGQLGVGIIDVGERIVTRRGLTYAVTEPAAEKRPMHSCGLPSHWFRQLTLIRAVITRRRSLPRTQTTAAAKLASRKWSSQRVVARTSGRAGRGDRDQCRSPERQRSDGERARAIRAERDPRQHRNRRRTAAFSIRGIGYQDVEASTAVLTMVDGVSAADRPTMSHWTSQHRVCAGFKHMFGRTPSAAS
jgi:hypothetical protein